MSDDNQLPHHPADRPCHICQNSDFTWGKLVIHETTADNDALKVFYRPAMTTFEDGDIPVHIRHCNICNNIQIFSVDS